MRYGRLAMVGPLVITASAVLIDAEFVCELVGILSPSVLTVGSMSFMGFMFIPVVSFLFAVSGGLILSCQFQLASRDKLVQRIKDLEAEVRDLRGSP